MAKFNFWYTSFTPKEGKKLIDDNLAHYHGGANIHALRNSYSTKSWDAWDDSFSYKVKKRRKRWGRIHIGRQEF